MKVLAHLVLDAVGMAGLGAFVYGVHQVYAPAAWMVGGLLGAGFALVIVSRLK